MKSVKSTKKGWRMTATYSTGQSKTVTYGSKKKALKAADAELTYGATDVEVWDE